MKGLWNVPYYHVRIWIQESTENRSEVCLDLTREELKSRVLAPRQQGLPITVNGKTILLKNIDRIRINKTEQAAEELRPLVQQKRSNSLIGWLGSSVDWYIAMEGEDVTDEFITDPPGMEPAAAIEASKNLDKEVTPSMRVFISHSSLDAKLATILIDLMRKSLNLRSTDIRCSSVDGYRLPGGIPTDQSLRAEVHDAELMIGLITPNSLKSIYVSFELGARWGADRPMIPLLASGATSEHLGGPLAGINALDCSNESQVNQLIEEASIHLKVDHDQPSSYVAEVKSLVQESSESAVAEEQGSTVPETPQLSEEASSLLIEAAQDSYRLIHKIGLASGLLIRTNGKELNEVGNLRSEAKWEGALDDLFEQRLVKDYNGKGTAFVVTNRGFDVADSLEES